MLSNTLSCVSHKLTDTILEAKEGLAMMASMMFEKIELREDQISSNITLAMAGKSG